MNTALQQIGALCVWSDCSFCKWQLGLILSLVLFKLAPSWFLDNGAARKYIEIEQF